LQRIPDGSTFNSGKRQHPLSFSIRQMGTHCSLGSHRITAEDGIEHCTVLGN
jgi:hypothetical protein